MVDTTIYQNTSDGFKEVIDYEPYLQQRKAELLGIKKEWRPVKKKVDVPQPDGSIAVVEEIIKRQLPDGSWQDVWEEVIIPPSPATQLVNEAGAEYIIMNLRPLFNKHSSMGNIRTNQEAAKNAARVVQSIYAHVEANSSIYGCSDEKFAALEGCFDADMISVYNFFTSMRDQKLMEFGKETQQASYTAGAPPQERKGISLMGN